MAYQPPAQCDRRQERLPRASEEMKGISKHQEAGMPCPCIAKAVAQCTEQWFSFFFFFLVVRKILIWLIVEGILDEMKYINNNNQTVAEQAYAQKGRKATHASVPVYPQQVTVGESKGPHSSAKVWSQRFCGYGFNTWSPPSAPHQTLRNLPLVTLSASDNERVEWQLGEFQYPVFLFTAGCPHSQVRTSVLLFPTWLSCSFFLHHSQGLQK